MSKDKKPKQDDVKEKADTPEVRKQKKQQAEKAQASGQNKMKGKQIVRFAETNVDAASPVLSCLRKVKGIGHNLAHAIVADQNLAGRKLNTLSETELAALEKLVLDPASMQLPRWMLNRRKDWSDGSDKHYVASKLDFSIKTDINRMKKMKTYKGVRHSLGQPVRGQRTRSSFRTGGIVGVTRKKEEPAKAAPAKEGK